MTTESLSSKTPSVAPAATVPIEAPAATVPIEAPAASVPEAPTETPAPVSEVAAPVLAMAGKPSLTVAIIAHNEQDRLPKTLEQIQDIASEIILINSCSTDNTVAVAQSYGAKVFTEEFKGYVEQKNSLIPKCTQDWILFLDADEVVNDDLKAAIVKAIASGNAQA